MTVLAWIAVGCVGGTLLALFAAQVIHRGSAEPPVPDEPVFSERIPRVHDNNEAA